MREEWRKWAPMPLRVMLGFGFAYHGFPKLFDGAAREGFVGMLQGIGIPAPGLMAWVVAIVEVFGGIALVLGAFVAVAGSLLVIEMLVAMFTVHWAHGFSFIQITGMTEAGPQFGMPGIEVNLLYLAGLLALLLRGPSHLSVDQMLAERKQATPIPPPPPAA